MPKFVFAYHGGKKPESEAEGQQMMAAWQSWMETHKDAMVDPGNPVGMSKTVTGSGVIDNGGSNPLSGYTLVNAPDMDTAIDIAKGCPFVDHDGSIEVVEAIEM